MPAEIKKIDFKTFYFSKQNLLCLVISLIIFIFDRFTKINVLKNFSEQKSYFINDFLNISLIWNTGVGFGVLSFDANFYYHLITFLIFIIIILILYFIFRSNFKEKIMFSTILGGALGNFYDRVSFYAVPDFIDIHYANFHWFTFNVADIFITLGIIFLLFNEFLKKDEKN